MKKTVLILLVTGFGFAACDNYEKTDNRKHYETSDTTTTHPRNSPADSSGGQ